MSASSTPQAHTASLTLESSMRPVLPSSDAASHLDPMRLSSVFIFVDKTERLRAGNYPGPPHHHSSTFPGSQNGGAEGIRNCAPKCPQGAKGAQRI